MSPNSVRISVHAVALAAVSLLTCAMPLHAQTTSSSEAAPEVSMDELALAQILGRTHASFDICHIAKSDRAITDSNVMAKARYIVSARYRQLGRRADAALHDEQEAYAVYMEVHRQTPSLPDCQVFQRQIYALTWDTVLVAALYVKDDEAHASASSKQ
jgi:hypothetical protein